MAEPEVRIVDVTAFDDEFVRKAYDPPPIRTVDVEAKRIKLKVGTFECDLDAGACYGSVTLDGKSDLKVKRMLVECVAGEVAKVQLDVICTPRLPRG